MTEKRTMPAELLTGTFGPIHSGWDAGFDACEHLAALLNAIRREALEPTSIDHLGQIRLLAEIGEAFAIDKRNFFDAQQEIAREWERSDA